MIKRVEAITKRKARRIDGRKEVVVEEKKGRRRRMGRRRVCMCCVLCVVVRTGKRRWKRFST